jgi:hypothetical protein
MADVTSSAENKGTAMNKVADLFVRLGQRGIILAAILMMETRPWRRCERILAISSRAKPALPQRHTKILRELGRNAQVCYSARAGTIMPRTHERESSRLVSAWKS